MAGVAGCIAKSRKRNNGRKGKVEVEGEGLVTTRREVVRKGGEGGWPRVERVERCCRHCSIGEPIDGALIPICSQARRFEQRRSKRPISDLDNSIRRPIIESIRAYPVPRSDTVLAEDSSGSILVVETSKEDVPRASRSAWKYFPVRGRIGLD
ncbi:hypothetical protein K0M31_005120 [Melipona bicolor]|uniref:Uncharacterized protein n=1 Tax=Melipona bicolor TaxID=60889 RepID=A0AA40KN79_9HYME|nr:hypothetical protein K0M31_005120 [Melipona bicolor]